MFRIWATSEKTVRRDRNRVLKHRIPRTVLPILLLCLLPILSTHSIQPASRATGSPSLDAVSSSTSNATSVYVSPSVLAGTSMTPGQNVTVGVFINNVANLDAWEYKIKTDTTVLKAVSADVTPYWENQQALGRGTYIIQVNATLGTGFVYWVSLRQPDGSIPSLTTSVPFQLGTATFQVLKTTQDTLLHIVTSHEDPNYGTILLDTNLNYISYTSTDGAFADIRLAWDVNWDLKVDIKDLVLVAVSFMATPGSPNWNPRADVNGDGHIDITDLTLVGIHFGEPI